MAKRTLNDRMVRALKPAKAGQRYDIADAIVPGLAVRVTDKGTKSFVLVARYPGSPVNPSTGHPNPTRRALGEYGALGLEQARTKARDWLALIRQGKNPSQEERATREAETAAARNTFGVVAKKLFPRLEKQRRGHVVKRIIENELLPAWEHRPIASITHLDVAELIEAVVERGARVYAHNVFDAAQAVFKSASKIIAVNPCKQLSRKDLIGQKTIRKRMLNDDELRACWRAARRLPYPYGPALRMLVLTGQRHADVTEAPRPEFDLANKLWTIPAERFKSDMPQLVPLTDDVCAILEALPRFKKGEFLFSTSFGEKPTAINSKIKDKIDERMLRSLKAMARLRGEDPKRVKLEPWVIHDLRRVVRSHLSALRVQDNIAEMIIGHGKKGLQRIYDQHRYVSEMREALTAWALRLRGIVDPPPANVVPLKARA